MNDLGAQLIPVLSDPVELTKRLIDIESPSHEEHAIATAIEAAVHEVARATAEIEVARFGSTVVARTHRNLGERVILAGHLDTVPLAGNTPHRVEGETLFGCGAVDMKSGLAVYLSAFARLAGHPGLNRDLTFIAYEGEEVATEFNGLGHLEKDHPEWLAGDLALLGEPTDGVIEAGCQGSIRVIATARGTRAHSARAWLGDNAAHKLAPIIAAVSNYAAREAVEVGGCVYREGLNVVRLSAGVANNTIPDAAECAINFRFAPDRTAQEALDHVYAVLGEHEGVEIAVDDVAPPAAPGLDTPIAHELVDSLGVEVRAKYGWTDVARFAAAGIPALNFGCGDPGFAHKPDEQCPLAQIEALAGSLDGFLIGE